MVLNKFDCSAVQRSNTSQTELLEQLNARVAAFESSLEGHLAQYVALAEQHQRQHQNWLERWANQLTARIGRISSSPVVVPGALRGAGRSEVSVTPALNVSAGGDGSEEGFGKVLPDLQKQELEATSQKEQNSDTIQDTIVGSDKTEWYPHDVSGQHDPHHGKQNRGYDNFCKHQKSKHLPESQRQHPKKKLEEAKLKVTRLKKQHTNMMKRNSSAHFISGALAKENANQTPKSRLHRTTHAAKFNVAVSLLIVCNVVLIGLQSDHAARHPYDETPLAYFVLDKFFTGVFFLEIMLRLGADGMQFWFGTHWRWNVFDFVVVMLSVVEEILSLPGVLGDIPNVMAVRILRLARLTRMSRIISVLKALHELRVIILSILGSLRSLFWVVLLLFVMLLVAGVFITQLVTEHVRLLTSDMAEHIALMAENEHFFNLVDLYGSVTSSTYSLFMAISGGADWGDMATPLIEEISPWFMLFFGTLVVIVVFAFLNIVLGIFVDHAMKSADNDREFAIQEEISSRNQYTVDVEILFREADQNGDGHISLEEVQRHFNDDRVAAWLHKLEIDPDSGVALFQMLDTDGHGVVEISDFVQGCCRLRGFAKSIDVALIHFDLRKTFSELRDRLDVRMAFLLKEIHGMLQIPMPDTAISPKQLDQLTLKPRIDLETVCIDD